MHEENWRRPFGTSHGLSRINSDSVLPQSVTVADSRGGVHGHPWSPMVTYGHPHSPMVTHIHLSRPTFIDVDLHSDTVTRGHPWIPTSTKVDPRRLTVTQI